MKYVQDLNCCCCFLREWVNSGNKGSLLVSAFVDTVHLNFLSCRCTQGLISYSLSCFQEMCYQMWQQMQKQLLSVLVLLQRLRRCLKRWKPSGEKISLLTMSSLFVMIWPNYFVWSSLTSQQQYKLTRIVLNMAFSLKKLTCFEFIYIFSWFLKTVEK